MALKSRKKCQKSPRSLFKGAATHVLNSYLVDLIKSDMMNVLMSFGFLLA